MKFYLSKICILTCILFVITSSQSIAQKATEEVLNATFSKAQLEDKKVLVIFHASWCGWCKKMEKQLKDPQISESIDDTFVITYLAVMEAKDKKDQENSGAAHQFLR
ncbi:thioredoxin-like protein [Leeuwenhoekiella aestuarii]|uniref:Thioredoxin-like protein n=1 Tax=Leeuwenhoekiella aestuarii TaxID=2249426 RepID=A0A4Q0NZQ7_9FLAO|nr:thioredoxin family protein [Leeuwenhoekiella aestuarii]RXG18463.1 thioredoxin-like protein [Leeuwenhoekiella aestuarii]RXG19768.1 thioredoxin-like protein [Leeuwenhoekiella aestuarii]